MIEASAWQRVRFWLVSFAITLLPERVKERDALVGYRSVAMHVVSGAAESVATAGLFIVGMIRYVSVFSHGAGWTYLANRPSLSYGDFFGIGALGFLSYLIRPLPLFLVYCYVEGIVRMVEATFSQRGLGLAVVSLVWRGCQAARRRARAAETRLLLGPTRPDEVVLPESSRFGMLEIYSVEEKPWSEVQVVEHLDRFFILTGRRLVARGKHHAWRYLLHEIEERDVIRGNVARYPQAGSAGASSRGGMGKRAREG